LVKGKLFALAIIAIANTVVSLFYYVRLIRDMFLYEAEGNIADQVAAGAKLKTLGGILAIVTLIPTLVLGIFWGQLANWIQLKVW